MLNTPLNRCAAPFRLDTVWMVLAVCSSAVTGQSAASGGDWQPFGPTAATILSLEADPGVRYRVLAGTYFGGIYESTDRGATWKPVPTSFSTFSVFSIAFDIRNSSRVFAGTFGGGVYRSLDGGRTWENSREGMEETDVLAIAVDPYDSESVMAVGARKVYRSLDRGKSWFEVTISGMEGYRPRCVTYDLRRSGHVYIGTAGKGVFFSPDGGDKWERLADGMGDVTVNSLAFNNLNRRKLYAATSQGYIYRLIPGEGGWKRINLYDGEPLGEIYSVQPHPSTVDTLMAASAAGVYVSLDDGKSWSLVLLKKASLIKTDIFGETFYAADIAGGFQYTTTFGRTWRSDVQGLQNLFVGALALQGEPSNPKLYAGTEYGVFARGGSDSQWSLLPLKQRVFTLAPDPVRPQALFAGTEGAGVWRTLDGGASWAPTTEGILPSSIYSLDGSSSGAPSIYAGTSSGLYLSNDGGQSWQSLTEVILSNALSVAVAPANGQTAYVGTLEGSVFKTTNGGLNFSRVSDGLPPAENIRLLRVSPLSEQIVYAITSGGRLFLTENGGGEWHELRPGMTGALSFSIHAEKPWILLLGTAGNGLLRSVSGGLEWEPVAPAGGSAFVTAIATLPSQPSVFYAGTQDGLLKSTDEGATWERVGEGLPPGAVAFLAIDPEFPDVVYASLTDAGVHRSSDGGRSWGPLGSGLPARGAVPIYIHPRLASRLIAGTNGNGIYLHDDASGWQPSSGGMSLFVRGLGFDAGNPDVLYAGSLTGGAFRSDDHGETWKQIGLADQLILQLKPDPVRSGVVYAGTTSGIAKTEDGGTTWRQMGQKTSFAFSLAADPRRRNVVFAGGSSGRLLRSDDGGRSWAQVGRGLPAENILALTFSEKGDALYLSSDRSGLFRSDDDGQTWQPMGGPSLFPSRAVRITADPATGALYAATDGRGVLICLDGRSWAEFNQGLDSLKITSVLGVPSEPGTLLTASSETGLYRSRLGKPWEKLSVPLPNEYIQLMVSDGRRNLYLASETTLLRSADWGVTWERIGAGLPEKPLSRLFVDPFDDSLIYAIVEGDGLYRSSNRGAGFERLSPLLENAPLNDLAFGADSAVLYGGTLGLGIILSQDSGANWTNAAEPETIQPFVLSLAINPRDSRVVYAGVSFGVLKSLDGGETWKVYSTQLDAKGALALAIDRTNPDILYAATTAGVYVTHDGGEHWRVLGKSMFHTNVTAVAVNPFDSNQIFAGTEGGGVFRYVAQ